MSICPKFPTKSSGSLSYLVCTVLLLVHRTGASSFIAVADDQELVESQSLDGNDNSGRLPTPPREARAARVQRHLAEASRELGIVASSTRTKNNSPALNHFLEDVLNAQSELKWIDRAVHRSANQRDNESSLNRRKNRDRKIGRGYSSSNSYERPRRVYLEEEVKAKREADEKQSDVPSSLASLKTTILELSDSLNPREYHEPDIVTTKEKIEKRRKLLWSDDTRSAMGVAIAYYDYEDDAESAGAMLNRPFERETKQEATSPPEITKKDENAEEERREELKRQRLKNKHPKEEFLNSNAQESIEDKNKNVDVEKPIPSSSNSLYPSLVLKRMPEASESDASDFYSRCEVGSSMNSDGSVADGGAILRQTNSFSGENIANLDENQDFFDERTYLVISPIEKRAIKRSVDSVDDIDDEETSSFVSKADKSARNYAALKITDDMFKGGVEQSNPLDEDKPIVVGKSFSASSSPTLNSLASSRFTKIKTTSPEWKVIEVAEKKKLEPRNSVHSQRRFGRRLTQIVQDNDFNLTFISSTSLSPTTNNQLHETTLILQQATSNNETLQNASKHREMEFQSENVRIEKNLFSYKQNVYNSSRRETIISQRYRFSQQIVYENSTFDPKTSSTNSQFSSTNSIKPNVAEQSYNNTRPRRNAEIFAHKKIPKRRRHRARRRHKIRKNSAGRKKLSNDSEAQHGKLTVLLATDNIEDESQMDLAVHGELAGKIVERIFEQVQRNDVLKMALGPGLYRNHKPQESMALEKMYRQGLDENEVKETESMMRRVMELLGRLVLDEVRRKTCATLVPDMRDFLQWSLGLDEPVEPLSDQIPPLPLIPDNQQHEATERPNDKFLFPNGTNMEGPKTDVLSELERKVVLLKRLIKEYDALTEHEKTKVQTVHDYLVRQLSLLMKYIETKEAAEKGGISENLKIAQSRLPVLGQQILEYQPSIPNRSLVKKPANTFNSINDKSGKRQNYEIFESRRFRRDEKNHRGKIESPEFRKLLRRISSLRRRKRDESWGYEKPKIFVESSKTIFSSPRRDLGNSSIIPVRGKNRLEDEVLLLNKREAWKNENRLMLEEVAFGKDTRDDLPPGNHDDRYNFSSLKDVREKRDALLKKLFLSSTTITPSTILDVKKHPSNHRDEKVLDSIETRINVFPVETTIVEITTKKTSD